MPIVVCLALLVVGCGAKPSSHAPKSRAVAVLPDVPFETLDHDQRIQFMKDTVVPAMQPIFQRHDAKEYAEFGCKTCHGEGAAVGNFEMPNVNLPALDFADLSKHEPADLEWMSKQVKPAMAKLLREPEYSKEAPDGFGCAHCHPVATK